MKSELLYDACFNIQENQIKLNHLFLLDTELESRNKCYHLIISITALYNPLHKVGKASTPVLTPVTYPTSANICPRGGFRFTGFLEPKTLTGKSLASMT